MNPRHAAMAMDAAAGMTYAEIAKRYGLSSQRVGQIIIKVRQQVHMTRSTKEHLGVVLARHTGWYRELGNRAAENTPCRFYWDELVPNVSLRQGAGGW